MKKILTTCLTLLAATLGLTTWADVTTTSYTDASGYANWSYTTIYAWRTPTTRTSGGFSGDSLAKVDADGTVSDTTASAGTGAWGNWCNTQSNYSKPGYAMLFDTAASGNYRTSFYPDFGPFNIAGIIVKSGASGYSIATTTARNIYLGDEGGTTETYFDFEDDFTVSINTTHKFFGTVNLTIASGKTFNFDGDNTSSSVTLDTGTSTCLKMNGAGAMKVNSLTATGAVTLDYTGVTGTDPFITGNVTIDASTTIKLPAGTAATTGYKLCSGTLAAGTTANIVVGETTYEGVTIAVSEGTLTWKETTELSAEITTDTAWDDLEWSATLPSDISACELTITGSGTVTGPTSLTVRSLTIGEGVTFNGTVNGTLDGAGTLALSSLVAPTIASTWTGTVVLPSSLTSGTNIGAYCNANSTVKLGGDFSGYFAKDLTISGTFDLGGFTWDITNGYSDNFDTINKLVGTGTIKSTWSNSAACQPIKINDYSSFTGTFESNSHYCINPAAKVTNSAGKHYYTTIAAAITAAGEDNLTQILIVDTTAEVPTGYFISDTSIAKCAAKIGETYYNTITAAFTVATSNDEVTVNATVTEAISAVPAGVTLTIPSGKTLTLGGTEGDNTVVRVNEGATINVYGTLDYGYTRLDNVKTYTMNVYAGATLQGTGNAESGCTACGPDFADAAVTVNVLANDEVNTTIATWAVATRVRTASTINVAEGITLNMSGNLVVGNWYTIGATITKSGAGTLNFTGTNSASDPFSLTAGTIISTSELSVTTTDANKKVSSTSESGTTTYTLVQRDATTVYYTSGYWGTPADSSTFTVRLTDASDGTAVTVVEGDTVVIGTAAPAQAWVSTADDFPANVTKILVNKNFTFNSGATGASFPNVTITLAAGVTLTMNKEISDTTVITTVDGYVVVNSGSTYTSTKGVAKIGETYYETLADAITAAGTDETTIELLADVVGNYDIPTGANITLKGNHSITYKVGTDYTIDVHGTLTIDGVTVVGIESYSSPSMVASTIRVIADDKDSGAHLIVKSGTITGGLNNIKSDEGAQNTIVIEGGTFTYNTANTSGTRGNVLAYCPVMIQGGTFTSSLNNVVVAAYDYLTGTADIQGGTFTATNGQLAIRLYDGAQGTPSVTKADSVSLDAPTGYKWGTDGTLVPSGSGAKIDGGDSYDTLEEAVTNAARNATVVISGADATITDKVLAKVNAVTIQATVAVAKNITVESGYCFAPTTKEAVATGNAVLVKAPETTSVDTSALSSGKVGLVFKNAKPNCTYYVMGADDVNGTYSEVATYSDNDGQFTNGTGTITVYYPNDTPSKSYYKAGVKSVND